MALSIAASNTYSDNTGTVQNHPVNLPTGIAAGNLLLMFFIANGNRTVTDPSGWSLLASGTTPNTYDTIRLYAKIASGSEGSTETVALDAAQRASAITFRVTGNRNGVTSSEIAVSAVNEQAATTNPNPPSLTPSWGSAENLWFAIATAHDGSMTWSAYPTNYSLGQNAVNTGSGNGNAIAAAARLLTATSEDPGTFTTVTNRNLSSFTLAVRPAVTALEIDADAGSYAVTGQATSLEIGRRVAATAGSYTVTGQAASLERGYKLAAAAGSYSIGGQDVTLTIGASGALVLSADVGAYVVGGQAASLELGRRIAAVPGSYAVTGTAASLKRGYKVVAASGSYSVSGQAASFVRSYQIASAAGAYTVTGGDADLILPHFVTADAGSYLVTGLPATLIALIPGPGFDVAVELGPTEIDIEVDAGPIPIEVRVEDGVAIEVRVSFEM